MSKSIFTRIIDREIPSTILYEDDAIIVIEDIHPKAPFHALAIAKKPIATLMDTEDEALLGRLMVTANKIAKKYHLQKGFRIVMNVGEDGGQTVPHLHMHILGKTKMREDQL